MLISNVIGLPFATPRKKKSGPPRADHLLIWAKFDEGAGQVVTDYSSNGNHGQLGTTSGADTNDPTWVSGGLRFGADDIVLCPHQDFTNFTYIIACKITAVPDGYTILMGQASGGSFGGPNMYFYNPASQITWSGDGLEAGIIADAVLNQIQMYSVTYDGTTLSGYLGPNLSNYGAATPSEVFYGSDGVFGMFGIGNLVNELNDFLGYGNKDIYYAVLYNTALTAEEIADTYTFIQAELSARGVTLP